MFKFTKNMLAESHTPSLTPIRYVLSVENDGIAVYNLGRIGKLAELFPTEDVQQVTIQRKRHEFMRVPMDSWLFHEVYTAMPKVGG